MIVDGNRRWAKQRMLETAAHGHRAGAAKIREFLTWCDDLGIRVVTLYLLSSDNLTNREDGELDDLVEIIADLADDLSKSARLAGAARRLASTGLPEQLVDCAAGGRGEHGDAHRPARQPRRRLRRPPRDRRRAAEHRASSTARAAARSTTSPRSSPPR